MSTRQRLTRPYEQGLDQHLLLRSVRDERDVERFAAFNTAINDAQQGQTCAQLLRHHPAIRFDDFLLVEDEKTGAVVSTTCLIPWRCRWGDVELDVAMLEMVVTHPDYRHRRLVRAQIERFHQAVAEQGFALGIIEGIPFYSRQFGYAYAGDPGPYDLLPAGRIPADGPGEATVVDLRPATVADLPTLQQFYAAVQRELDLYTERSADEWRFLLAAAHYPVQLVVARGTESPLGYVCLWPLGRGGLAVAECSLPATATAWAVLRRLKQEASGDLQLGGPAHNTLRSIGRTLGSQPGDYDQWLLRMVDPATLLARLGPLFERRLAASPSAGLTMRQLLNLFRQAYRLTFERGRLVGVENAGFIDASMGADGGDLCIPPDAFVRLLIGFRSLAELHDAWPDLTVKPASRLVIETLFPKQASYFCLPYLYRGVL